MKNVSSKDNIIIKDGFNFFGLKILKHHIYDAPCSFAIKHQYEHTMF